MFNPDALPVPDLGFACPTCNYPLAGLSEHRCPECGRAFELEEFIPPGEFPPLIAGGRFVTASVEVLALLKRYDVPVVEVRNEAKSVFGGVMTSATDRARLSVPRSRYLEAIDLIRRLEQDEPMPAPPKRDSASEAPWRCGACGEENPANFELCWNCEAPRP